MAITFSIVIPLFNKETVIIETINSVLNQTYQKFELIIVNDGSTDNSLQVVKQIEDKRIRIIDKPNGGVSSARNRGIEEAKYEYIAFLDGDDIWDPLFLEKMGKLIIDFPLASFFACKFSFQSSIKDKSIDNGYNKRGYIENYFKEALKYPLINSSSVVVKKDCFNQVGSFNSQYSRGEDIEMWSRLALNFKLAYEPELLSYYRLDVPNRACLNITPIEKFYLEKNISKLGKYHRKYILKLIRGIFGEFYYQKRYSDLYKLMINYNMYSLPVLIEILKDKVRKLNK